MHPIERLRYVARASGAPQDVLVRETAGALSAFRGDPAGLVTACRRVVSRQAGCGALWWLCSRLLCAPDPWADAQRAVEAIEDDLTSRRLAAEIPDDATVTVLGWCNQLAPALARRGDLDVLVVDAADEAAPFVRHLEQHDVAATEVPMAGLGAAVAASQLCLLDASAMGPAAALVVSGSRAAAAVAHHAGVPVWMAAGVGRVLPERVWNSLEQRLDLADEPWDADDEILPLDLVDMVVGPDGAGTVAEAVARTDCPIAPELFKADIT